MVQYCQCNIRTNEHRCWSSKCWSSSWFLMETQEYKARRPRSIYLLYKRNDKRWASNGESTILWMSIGWEFRAQCKICKPDINLSGKSVSNHLHQFHFFPWNYVVSPYQRATGYSENIHSTANKFLAEKPCIWFMLHYFSTEISWFKKWQG